MPGVFVFSSLALISGLLSKQVDTVSITLPT